MSKEAETPQEYLDRLIRFWRGIKKATLNVWIMALADFYIVGYQTARVLFLGEEHPPEEKEE